MKLYLRLILLFAKHLIWRPPTPMPLLDVSVHRARVWLSDLDFFGHVNNSRYLALTDLAVLDHMFKAHTLQTVVKRRWIPIVVVEECVFLRSMKFPDQFEIHTRIAGWDDTNVVFLHEFRRGSQRVADAMTITRFVARGGGSVSTAAMAEAFGISPVSPSLGERSAAALARYCDVRAAA